MDNELHTLRSVFLARAAPQRLPGISTSTSALHGEDAENVSVNNASVNLTADERLQALEAQFAAFGGQFQALMTVMQTLQPGQPQPPNVQPPAPTVPSPTTAPTAATDRRRPLNPSNLTKLNADVTLVQLES